MHKNIGIHNFHRRWICNCSFMFVHHFTIIIIIVTVLFTMILLVSRIPHHHHTLLLLSPPPSSLFIRRKTGGARSRSRSGSRKPSKRSGRNTVTLVLAYPARILLPWRWPQLRRALMRETPVGPRLALPTRKLLTMQLTTRGARSNPTYPRTASVFAPAL